MDIVSSYASNGLIYARMADNYWRDPPGALEIELPAGEHLLVVDTFTRGDEPQAGRYTLAVARVDLPSDRREVTDR